MDKFSWAAPTTSMQPVLGRGALQAGHAWGAKPHQNHKKQTLTFAGWLARKNLICSIFMKITSETWSCHSFCKTGGRMTHLKNSDRAAVPSPCRHEWCAGIEKNTVLRWQSQWTPLLSLQMAFLSVSVAQCWAYLVLNKVSYCGEVKKSPTSVSIFTDLRDSNSSCLWNFIEAEKLSTAHLELKRSTCSFHWCFTVSMWDNSLQWSPPVVLIPAVNCVTETNCMGRCRITSGESLMSHAKSLKASGRGLGYYKRNDKSFFYTFLDTIRSAINNHPQKCAILAAQ